MGRREWSWELWQCWPQAAVLKLCPTVATRKTWFLKLWAPCLYFEWGWNPITFLNIRDCINTLLFTAPNDILKISSFKWTSPSLPLYFRLLSSLFFFLRAHGVATQSFPSPGFLHCQTRDYVPRLVFKCQCCGYGSNSKGKRMHKISKHDHRADDCQKFSTTEMAPIGLCHLCARNAQHFLKISVIVGLLEHWNFCASVSVPQFSCQTKAKAVERDVYIGEGISKHLNSVAMFVLVNIVAQKQTLCISEAKLQYVCVIFAVLFY